MQNLIDIQNIRKNDPKIFVTLSADYANVGDVAITIVQKQILKNIFPNYQIIEIPMMDFYDYKSYMENIINDNDLITIIGGGNMGSIYIGAEERRRNIISSFPKNKIISFPQSIDFEENEYGKKEFQTSIDIYGKHKNLTIFSREKRSYAIMSSNFKNKVELVPDTVMYLMGNIQPDKNIARNKILLCFRDDKEKVTTNNITNEIIELLNYNNFENIELIDTHLGNITFKPNEKEKIFNNLLEKIQSAKILITDRLHGMIFSLITKTPCIAFDNSNKKISSTYDTWLKGIPYIKVLDSFQKEKIIEYANNFSTLDTNSIQIDFQSKFEPLISSIKNLN